MLESLWHIGSMAVLTGTVFLGLDKSEEKPRHADTDLRADMEKLIADYRGSNIKNDLKLKLKHPFRWKIIQETCDGKSKFWVPPRYMIWRFSIKPLAPWFKPSLQTRLVSLLTLASVVCYFIMVFCSGSHGDPPMFCQDCFLTLFSINVLAVFFFAWGAQRNRQFTRNCKKWWPDVEADIREKIGELADAAEADALRLRAMIAKTGREAKEAGNSDKDD